MRGRRRAAVSPTYLAYNQKPILFQFGNDLAERTGGDGFGEGSKEPNCDRAVFE